MIFGLHFDFFDLADKHSSGSTHFRAQSDGLLELLAPLIWECRAKIFSTINDAGIILALIRIVQISFDELFYQILILLFIKRASAIHNNPILFHKSKRILKKPELQFEKITKLKRI